MISGSIVVRSQGDFVVFNTNEGVLKRYELTLPVYVVVTAPVSNESNLS